MNKEIKTEDVGDKYLQNKYNIPTDFDKFDQKYLEHKLANQKSSTNDIIIFKKKSHKDFDQDWLLVKNPSNLDGYGANVRGIILASGDFYLESGSETIHNDILKILYEKNILKVLPRKDWTSKLPEETGFLTMQRFRDSTEIRIGESNKLIYDDDDRNKLEQYYMKFINAAKAKCQGLNFVYELVGTKANIKPASQKVLDILNKIEK